MVDNDFEIGTVKSISNGRTVVELKPSEVCESCSARILCRPGNDGKHEMVVLNTINARPGDMVELTETGHLLLILSLMQYGLPLLGLLVGIFLVYGFNPNLSGIRIEVIMATTGFLGLLLGGGLAYIGLKYISRTIDSVFKITAVRSVRSLL